MYKRPWTQPTSLPKLTATGTWLMEIIMNHFLTHNEYNTANFSAEIVHDIHDKENTGDFLIVIPRDEQQDAFTIEIDQLEEFRDLLTDIIDNPRRSTYE